MFDKEFFPTPKRIIKKMIAPYSGRSILEPSAGKGDILDYMKESPLWKYSKLYCMENNPELQMILREKKHRLIGSDFLNYNGNYFYDLIIMNPPFSNGDEHLLKAWEIMKTGDIVCLLNRETYDNPCTKRRQLLKSIIEENGTVEYLGSCFDSAQRKTGVQVIMVRLKKKTEDSTYFEFEQKDQEKKHSLKDVMDNPVAKQDVIENMVQRFEKLRELYIEQIKIVNKMKYYACDIEDIENIIKESNRKDEDSDKYNEFTGLLKSKYWDSVFIETNFREVMTEKVRDEFDKFRLDQGGMDFTEENIKNLLVSLQISKKDILNGCLLDVFDRLTMHDKKNKVHIEGWKTNDAWKVNRRVIIPRCVEYRNWGVGSFVLPYSSYTRFLSDIDKVLCLLAGKNLADIVTIEKALKDRFKESASLDFDNKAESEFFDLKFYLKGTLHLYFKDEHLWQEFNIRAAKEKNWLPDDYNKRG